MRWRFIFLLIVLYGVYLLIGAAVFWSLEYSHEEQSCQQTLEQLRPYNITSATTRDSINLTSEDLKEFIKIIQQAKSNGVQFDSNGEASCANNWNFQNAFFFAGTVLTTIGYGHIAPTTYGGQVFCIFFAALGLPLFAIMFSEIGKKFAKVFKRLDRKLENKGQKGNSRNAIVLVVTLATMIVFCLLIPSAIFIAVEDWNYHEAFYYSFISLTTIGFGDFVVGSNPDIDYPGIYRVAVYFWILFGLAFMATVISVFSDLIKERGRKRLPDSVSEEDSIENRGAENREECPSRDEEKGENHNPDEVITMQTLAVEQNELREKDNTEITGSLKNAHVIEDINP